MDVTPSHPDPTNPNPNIQAKTANNAYFNSSLTITFGKITTDMPKTQSVAGI
jgi:hypothetical protein